MKMKQIIITIMFSFFLCSFTHPAENEIINKKLKIAIFPFQSVNVEESLTYAIVENFTTAIIDTESFTVVERSQLDMVFEELSLSTSDDFKETDAVLIGQMSGAELVFLGSITKIGDNITINVRGINVISGEAEFAKKITTKSEEKIPSLIDELAILVASQFAGVDIKEKIKIDISELNKKSTVRAGIITSAVGGGLILTGISFLAGSLGYNYYLENNNTGYANYTQGKQAAQGLFYGSIAVLSTGTITASVSIPLFLIKRKKRSK